MIEGLKKENADLQWQNGTIMPAFKSFQAKLQKILSFKDKEPRPLRIEAQAK